MKKWLLSKLLLLLGLTTFSQTIEYGPILLNEPTNILNGEIAQGVNILPPVAGDVHPELAAALQERLDSLVVEYGVQGLSAALIVPSGDVWKGASGLNSIQQDDTLTTEMLLGMGSVSKTFTGAVIMQLVEEGQLTLNDTLGQWLPAYPNVDSSITVRQLLNHTSGIFNYTDNPDFSAYLNANLSEVFEPEFVLENYVPEPSFTPGAQWGYSNSNYLLLGLIIEAITGNDYAEEVRNRLLTPNDHSTMSLHPDEMPTGEIAHLWLDLTGNGQVDDFTANGLSIDGLFSMAWAAGAFLTTPEDLAHWVKNLMTGKVVEQSTVEMMQETVPVVGNLSYGLSLMNFDVGNSQWWGHNGSIGYLTMAFYSPDLDISMVLICSQSPFDAIDDAFFELVFTYLTFMPTSDSEVLENQMDLLAFPNPFSTDLMLAFDLPSSSDIQMTITNQLGQIVHQMDYDKMPKGMNNIRLENTEHWPSGLYHVELKNENWMMVEQVVKE